MAIETISSTVTDSPPSGVSLIDEIGATNLSLRGLIAGSGISLTVDTSDGETKVVVASPQSNIQSVGGGAEIVKSHSSSLTEMRSIIAGDNVTVTQMANTIRIDSISGITAINRGSTGEGVFATIANGELQFRRLTAGQNVSLAATNNEIEISAMTGERNTGTSLGEIDDGGHDLYAGMDGTQLQFKKLFAGPNIRLIDNGCGIMIAAGVPAIEGGYIDAISLGTGADIYAGREDTFLKFRSVVGTGGTTVSETASEIIIDAGGEDNTATNVGAGVGLFRNKNGLNLEFKSLVAGEMITLEANDDHVVVAIDAVLGEPSEGNFDDPLEPGGPAPAIQGWTSQTRIADALDQINKILGTIVNA